jgi:hypothetical protein
MGEEGRRERERERREKATNEEKERTCERV